LLHYYIVRNRVICQLKLFINYNYFSNEIICQLELIELVIDQNELKYLLHYNIELEIELEIFVRNRVICQLELFVN
jgi:hypothetical protein